MHLFKRVQFSLVVTETKLNYYTTKPRKSLADKNSGKERKRVLSNTMFQLIFSGLKLGV